MNHRIVAATGLTLLVVAAGAASADARALPPRSSFTVQTSFLVDTSPIVAADGLWSGCTQVVSLSNVANQVSPTKLLFSGEKQVVCPGGDVVVHYDATTNMRNGQGLTFGSWSVVSSDNPSIAGGAGSLSGDARGCADCILDTFTGRVY